MTRRIVATILTAAVTVVTMGAGVERRDSAGTIEALTKTIEKDPLDVGALLNRGLAHENLRQFDKALADYTRAIGIHPRFARAYHFRGRVYAKLNQHGRALADYDEALINADAVVIDAQGGIIPLDRAAAYLDRGDALVKLEKWQEAIESYGSAIALDPELAAAYNNRGMAYAELGNLVSACADRSKACALGLTAACAWTKGNC